MSEEKLDPVRVRIRNYQSIEDVELEVRGFTCVTGRTNAGKSAIMRAISGAILNDSVVGKVRKGTSFCTVDISSSKWGFRWEKGTGGVNRYTIDGKVYDKVGQVQLPQIAQMGFGSVKVGDKEIQPWWSSQFFPLFLLDKSGPQVTDFISEVSRLTVLQDAVVLSGRGKRSADAEAKSKSEEAGRARDKLAGFSGVADLEKLYADLEAQAVSASEYEARVLLAGGLDSKITDAQTKIRILSPVGSAKVPEDKIGPLMDSLASMYGFWRTLEASAKKIIAFRPAGTVQVPDPPEAEHARWVQASKFARIAPLKASVKALSAAVPLPDPSGMDEAAEKVKRAAEHRSAVSRASDAVKVLSKSATVPHDGVEAAMAALAALRRVEDAVGAVTDGHREWGSVSKELSDLEAEIAAIPSCPTCERPVAAKHAH